MEAQEESKKKEDKGKEKEKSEPEKLVLSGKGRPFDAALFGTAAQRGFHRLWKNGLYFDVTLHVNSPSGGEPVDIKSHKAVLVAWSERFEKLIAEAGGDSIKELNVQVGNEDKPNFKFLIEFLYTGSVVFVDQDNVLSIIRLAHDFGIDPLKEECGDLLGQKVNDENMLFMLDVVDKYTVNRLNSACGFYLAEHFTDMLESSPERLYSLKVSTWAEMLKSDHLQIRSEELLFEAVLKFAYQLPDQSHHKPGDASKEALALMLPQIRFNFLNPKYLANNVEEDEKLQEIPIVHQLVHQCYRWKMYPKSKTLFPTTPRKGFQRFDPDHCNTSLIKLSDDGETATLTGSGWQNVRCVCPFSEKYSYCEFKVHAGTNLMLGVVDGDVSRNSHAGQYANGWTYYSPGQVYHSGTIPATGQAYNAGDRVGVYIDFENSKVVFYRNGTMSISTTGLPKTGEFYPVACFSSTSSSVSIIPHAPLPDDIQDKKEKEKEK